MQTKRILFGILLIAIMLNVNATWNFKYISYNATVSGLNNLQIDNDGNLHFMSIEYILGKRILTHNYIVNDAIHSIPVFEGYTAYYNDAIINYRYSIDNNGLIDICIVNGTGWADSSVYYYKQSVKNGQFTRDDSFTVSNGDACDIKTDANNKPHIVYSTGATYMNFQHYRDTRTEKFINNIFWNENNFDGGLGSYYNILLLSTDNYKYIFTANQMFYNLTPVNTIVYSSYKSFLYHYGYLIDNIVYYEYGEHIFKQNSLHSNTFTDISGANLTQLHSSYLSLDTYLGNIYFAYIYNGNLLTYSNDSGNYINDLIDTGYSGTPSLVVDSNGKKYIIYTVYNNSAPIIRLAYENISLSASGRIYDSSIVTKPSISGAWICFNGVSSSECGYSDSYGYYAISGIESNKNYNEVVIKGGYVTFNESVNLQQSLINNDIGLFPSGTIPNTNYTSVRFEFKYENSSPVISMTVNFKINTFCPACASTYPFSTSSSGRISTSLPKGSYTITLPEGYYIIKSNGLENSWNLDFTSQTNYLYSYIVRKVESYNYTSNIKVLSDYDNRPIDRVLVYVYNTETKEEYSAYTNTSGDIIIGFSKCGNNVNYILTKTNYSISTGTYEFNCYDNTNIVLYMNKAEYLIELNIIDYDTFQYVENYSVKIDCPALITCIDGKANIIKESDINGKIVFTPQIVGRYYLTTIGAFADYLFYNVDTKAYYTDFSLEIGSTKKYYMNIYVKHKISGMDIYGQIIDTSNRAGLDNVGISVLSEDGQNYYITNSNSSGGYYIENMTTEKYYTFSLIKSGYTYPSSMSKYRLFIDAYLPNPYKYDMWLSVINTTNKYNYSVKGIVGYSVNGVCDNNTTLEYSDVIIQCEYSHTNDFQRTSSDGIFNFSIYSFVKPESCIIQIVSLNTRLEIFQIPFELSGEKDFGLICLNETSLKYPLQLCFVNNKNCLVNPLNCEKDSIYTIPNINVTLSLINTNSSVLKRALTGLSGCVSFNNVVYGDYNVNYLSDYFEGGEDSLKIDESSLLLTNGKFYKLYKLEPKFQLYTLDIHIYYIENLTYLNWTSGKHPLGNAEVTIYDLDREITVLEEKTDSFGYILKEGLPNSKYRITVKYSNYKTQTADFILSTLTGDTKKYYEFTFLFTKGNGEENAQNIILSYLTGDYAIYGILAIFGLFGIYVIVLLISGIYDSTIGKFKK